MKKLLASMALVAISTQSYATMIDFDFDANGDAIAFNTPITDQYQAWGVMFAGFEDGNAIDINAAPDPDGVVAPSAPNVLTNCNNAGLGCPGNRADVVEIWFASGASNISLELDTLGSESVTFNLFDMGNALVESLSITSSGSMYVPVSFTASGVSRIEALQPNDGWAWAMDNLSFDATRVPEPGTLALVSLALFGLGRMRKQNS